MEVRGLPDSPWRADAPHSVQRDKLLVLASFELNLNLPMASSDLVLVEITGRLCRTGYLGRRM